MDRRQLFRMLAATSLGLLGGPAMARTRPADPVLIQVSPLAGFQYYAGEDLWPRLREDDLLALIREPANAYDRRAVRVEWRGRKLGYVPRMENAAIAQMLDRGTRLTARIERLWPGPDPWQRIRFTVTLG